MRNISLNKFSNSKYVFSRGTKWKVSLYDKIIWNLLEKFEKNVVVVLIEK